MIIDIVYTWVDGSDPAWNKKKLAVKKSLGKLIDEADSSSRFTDNDELKYSLRSIYKFAPWVNNIFIVTDKQVPKWLNTNHPKIHIIDHNNIFINSSYLPTFSSRCIETQLHHINDLAEHFLFFNDDMFLGRETTPETFFSIDGRPFIFVSEAFPIPKKKMLDANLRDSKKLNSYQHGVINSRLLLKQRFGKAVYYNTRHGVKTLRKSILYKLEELFTSEIEYTAGNPFRTNKDILMFQLFSFYVILFKLGIPKYLRTIKQNARLFSKLGNPISTFGYINLHENDIEQKLELYKNKSPMMMCLNQTPSTPEKNIVLLKNFLKSYFPDKVPFEI